MLYLRAAALRIKVDEEATILATAMAAGVQPGSRSCCAKAKKSLDLGERARRTVRRLPAGGRLLLQPPILHQLYRSRFRLLRGFSGLWLIYDRQVSSCKSRR